MRGSLIISPRAIKKVRHCFFQCLDNLGVFSNYSRGRVCLKMKLKETKEMRGVTVEAHGDVIKSLDKF